MSNKSSPHGGKIEAGYIVSERTLRTQDLLRSFADEYIRVLPFNGLPLATEARDNAAILDMRKADGSDVAGAVDLDIADDVLADLQEALQTVAGREGLTFGANEGDGACFGYWVAADNE